MLVKSFNIFNLFPRYAVRHSIPPSITLVNKLGPISTESMAA